MDRYVFVLSYCQRDDDQSKDCKFAVCKLSNHLSFSLTFTPPNSRSSLLSSTNEKPYCSQKVDSTLIFNNFCYKNVSSLSERELQLRANTRNGNKLCACDADSSVDITSRSGENPAHLRQTPRQLDARINKRVAVPW